MEIELARESFRKHDEVTCDGVLINVGILIALLWAKWPPADLICW